MDADGSLVVPRVGPGGTGSLLQEATGSSSEKFQLKLVHQIIETLGLSASLGQEQQLERAGEALALLRGIAPQDELEGVLATQMVATHNAAMECLRRAALPEQTFQAKDMYWRHAAKLLSTYVRQMELLDRRRGKGQQSVTVRDVHVQAGAQAIVGTVESGGGLAQATKPRRASGVNSVSANGGD
jgi:hypothetical protein